jgi:hypothetical protein
MEVLLVVNTNDGRNAALLLSLGNKSTLLTINNLSAS